MSDIFHGNFFFCHNVIHNEKSTVGQIHRNEIIFAKCIMHDPLQETFKMPDSIDRMSTGE